MRPIIRELISCITVSGNFKDCKKLVEVQNIKARVSFFFFFFRKRLASARTNGVFYTEGVCWRFLAILGIGSHNDTQSIFYRVSTPATLAFLILLITPLMVFNCSNQLLRSPKVKILETFSLRHLHT